MAETVLDKSQNTYTDEQLKGILTLHKLWLDTDGQDGKRVDLSRMVLVGVNFQKAVLKQAILVETKLQGAELQGAKLQGATFGVRNFRGRNFKMQIFRK